MNKPNLDRFRYQLQRQIGFLRTSAALFDRGQLDEAIRIATSIRVLLHDTPNSISILKHLNAKDINIFTTVVGRQEKIEGYVAVDSFSMGILRLGGAKSGYGPDLEDFKPGVSGVLPAEQWWNQIVWRLRSDLKLARKDIVLAAANQDGGAHVDKELSDAYKILATEKWGTITVRKGSAESTMDITHMHLVAIRTMANELLKSPELANLSVVEFGRASGA
ncbi:MAG: hypothetical protein KAT11_01860 [Phycisphaerae bacterium]|nr:hypothetical protein [Phycisphaerae bacterium]